LLQFQDEKVSVLQAVKIWVNAFGKTERSRRRIFKETLRIPRIAIAFGEADPHHKKKPAGKFPPAGFE